MAYPIAEIEGIGPAYQEKLASAGSTRTGAFLENAASKKGREALAQATCIDEKRILSWANLADLMRIKGVGRQFSDLLHAAGVDTVKELRNRNATNLAAAVAAAHEKSNLARAIPSEGQLAAMIEALTDLDPTGIN